MRKIMLDTNVYVAFKRGDESVLDLIKTSEEIAFSAIVVGELMGGFLCGSRFEKNKRELDEFFSSPRVTVIEVNEETSLFYAKIYQHLKSKGKPIPTNDLWIAACAMQHGYPLCSYDKHFNVIDNLVTWSEA